MQINLNLNADKIKSDLRRAWEENTALCLVAGATALTGVAKLINANTERKNSKTWRKEVNRREKADSKRLK